MDRTCFGWCRKADLLYFWLSVISQQSYLSSSNHYVPCYTIEHAMFGWWRNDIKIGLREELIRLKQTPDNIQIEA